MEAADLDRDGDLDIVAGNWGTNTQIRVTPANPVKLYYGDFDNNGFVDPLLFHDIMGKSFPMASRDELTDQMVSLRQRFPTYDSYANAVLEDILDSNQIRTAGYLQSNFLETVWFENTPQGFLEHHLPVQANFAPVHAIHIDDIDKDGFQDLVLFGNTDQVRIKIGKMDANYGLLLKGDGQGGFITVGQSQSGFKLTGCVRDVIALQPLIMCVL